MRDMHLQREVWDLEREHQLEEVARLRLEMEEYTNQRKQLEDIVDKRLLYVLAANLASRCRSLLVPSVPTRGRVDET